MTVRMSDAFCPRSALFTLLCLVCSVGCSGGAHQGLPPETIAISSSCPAARGVVAQLETGVTSPCTVVVAILDNYRAAYEAAWGATGTESWTVRIRSERPTRDAAPGNFNAGETFFAERTIDVYQGSLNVYPHELHHVALGPDSADHRGWCSFGDWEEAGGILDESAYLGCPDSP
jgi:hypothetical protein